MREEPDLRIIDQLLWDAVKVRQAEARAERDIKFKLTGNPLTGTKQPTICCRDWLRAANVVNRFWRRTPDGGDIRAIGRARATMARSPRPN